MCLLIEILMPGVPRSEAGSLTRELAARKLLELSAQRQPRDAVGSRFLLSEPNEGCACSLLGENADWDQPYYELDPAHTAALEATLRFVVAKAGTPGFALRAAWLDGAFQNAAAAKVRVVRLDELLDDVRASRIRNNVCYEVSPIAV
jgi:hypothetical protein